MRRISPAASGLLLTLLLQTPVLASPDAAELYRMTGAVRVPDKAQALVAGATLEVDVDLDVDAIDRNPLLFTFDLPEVGQIEVPRVRFRNENGYQSWTGATTTENDEIVYVHLVDHGPRVSGILNVGSRQFQIVALAGRHHLAQIEPNSTWFLEDTLEDDAGTAGAIPTSAAAPEQGRAADGVFEKATTITIDVLALYPSFFPSAEEPSLLDFIQTSVSLANDVFSASNVNAQYRLVATMKLAGEQPPATRLKDVVAWMNNDPLELTALRGEYDADIVTMFVPYNFDETGPCGYANLPLKNGTITPEFGTDGSFPFDKRALSAQRNGCGLNDFTFAHELGHNFGMRHANQGTESVYLFPGGRGFLASFTPWHDSISGNATLDVECDDAIGYQFTPLVDGYVTGLGGFFEGNGTLQVSGASISVDVTNSNTWMYLPAINAVKVSAGMTYTVRLSPEGQSPTSYLKYTNITLPKEIGHAPDHMDIRIERSVCKKKSSSEPILSTDTMYSAADIQFAPHAVPMASLLACNPQVDALPQPGQAAAVCGRVPFLSDPDTKLFGLTMGTATNNNAEVARVQAQPYSKFGPNRAPKCVVDYVTTTMNSPKWIFIQNLLANDSDPFDTVNDTVRVASYEKTTVFGGTNGNIYAGHFTYTPPPGFTGTDSFKYTISDRPAGHVAAKMTTCGVVVTVQ